MVTKVYHQLLLQPCADGRVSNLHRRRYAQNDDTLYVAPEDERTDYVGSHAVFCNAWLIPMLVQSQPPMANWYEGVLK